MRCCSRECILICCISIFIPKWLFVIYLFPLFAGKPLIFPSSTGILHFLCCLLGLYVVWGYMKKEKNGLKAHSFQLVFFVANSSALLALMQRYPCFSWTPKRQTHNYFCGWWSSETWLPYLHVFWRCEPICTDSYFYSWWCAFLFISSFCWLGLFLGGGGGMWGEGWITCFSAF